MGEMIAELGLSTESRLTITCQPLAVFRVRPVTRCGETLPGHSDAVLHVSYSPDGTRLARLFLFIATPLIFIYCHAP